MKSIVPAILTSFTSRTTRLSTGILGRLQEWNFGGEMAMSRSSFVTKYLDRIGLDRSLFYRTAPLDYSLLCQVTEAHLSNIPFENLAQHGGYGGPVQLDLDATAEKILDRKRGGFCLELNSLFASFLGELGLGVVIVPAVVYKEGMGGFDNPATHIFLIATIPNGDDEASPAKKYFVDVGFGEPPSNPLLYEFDTVQTTSEGMKSRLMESNGRVTLEWFKKNEWKPRLQWNLNDSLTSISPRIEDFKGILDLVYEEKSIFSRKLIVCRLTRGKKVTLTGSKLKETIHRYDNTAIENVQTTIIESLDQAREILSTQFGIDPKETKGINWDLVTAQDPELFSHM